MPTVFKKRNKAGKEVGSWRGRYTSATGERTLACLTYDRGESQRLLDDMAIVARAQQIKVEHGLITRSEAIQIDAADMPMSRVISGYIGQMQASKLSKTQERLRLDRIMGKKNGGCNIETIRDLINSAGKVQAFLRSLMRTKTKKGLAPNTINRYLTAYRSLCSWCLETDHHYLTIETNPGPSVKMPNCQSENARLPHRALSVDEMVQLCYPPISTHDSLGRKHSPKVRKDRKDRILNYRLAAITGFRGEEIQRLQVEDFRFADFALHLPQMKSKTKRCSVTVPLTTGLCKALAERFEGKPPKTYCWPRGVNKEAFQGDLERAGVAAFDGAKHINRRSLRKSHNAWLKSAGVDMETRMMLRRDVGTAGEKLVTETYLDEPDQQAGMRAGVVKLQTWLAEQAEQAIA